MGYCLQSIQKKIAAGIAYNTISRVFIIGVQAITSILLARVLSSSDYGIIAFASVFIGFISQFSDFGLGSSLVQRKDVSQTVLNTAFTIRNIAAFALFIIALVISFIVPYYYDYIHIGWVIRLMAINFIFHSFGFVSSALLKREMNFLGTNTVTLISTTSGSVVSVALAYMGFGFWSQVWAGFFSTIVNVVSNRVLRPVKLNYELNFKIAQEMWHFGSYLFISGIIIYALFNSANFIVGAVSGAVVLGYFSLALDWGTKIPSLLSQTVISVLFPAFSKIRENEELLIKTYSTTLKYVAFVSILVNVTLICVSEDFLKIVLGNGTDKWVPALNAFRILCLYGIVRAILEPIGSIITALGETKVLMKAVAVAALIQLTFLYPALKFYGLEGVSWLILISYGLQYYIYLSFLKCRAGIGINDFVKAIYVPVLCSIIFIALYLMGNQFVLKTSFLMMISKSVFYGVAYTAIFCLFTKFQLYYDIKRMIGR